MTENVQSFEAEFAEIEEALGFKPPETSHEALRLEAITNCFRSICPDVEGYAQEIAAFTGFEETLNAELLHIGVDLQKSRCTPLAKKTAGIRMYMRYSSAQSSLYLRRFLDIEMEGWSSFRTAQLVPADIIDFVPDDGTFLNHEVHEAKFMLDTKCDVTGFIGSFLEIKAGYRDDQNHHIESLSHMSYLLAKNGINTYSRFVKNELLKLYDEQTLKEAIYFATSIVRKNRTKAGLPVRTIANIFED
jgi:hypothetical protein